MGFFAVVFDTLLWADSKICPEINYSSIRFLTHKMNWTHSSNYVRSKVYWRKLTMFQLQLSNIHGHGKTRQDIQCKAISIQLQSFCASCFELQVPAINCLKFNSVTEPSSDSFPNQKPFVLLICKHRWICDSFCDFQNFGQWDLHFSILSKKAVNLSKLMKYQRIWVYSHFSQSFDIKLFWKWNCQCPQFHNHRHWDRYYHTHCESIPIQCQSIQLLGMK